MRLFYIIQLLVFINLQLIQSQTVSSTFLINSGSSSLVNPEALYPFFDKLTERENRAVRIVHWGDSHVQMGYFSLEIKKSIDSLFGIKGYGSIFPYRAAKYNPYHSYTKIIKGNWTGGNMMKDSSSLNTGFTGFWLNTIDSAASIRFGIGREPLFHTGNSQVTLVYKSSEQSNIIVKGINFLKDSLKEYKPIYQEILDTVKLNYDWKMLRVVFEEDIDIIGLEVLNNNSNHGFTLYGAIVENTYNKGVLYNNCGVGGAQFKHLIENAKVPIQQVAALETDLFIISFGSNESYTESFNYEQYKKSISSFISSLKSENPEASILLTGPPDTRSKNRYPRNTASICSVLKQLSYENGFSFWDLQKAMGGDGSVLMWLKNGLASKDKLHFTKEGYFLQGKWLLREIELEYKKYVSVKEK